MKNGDTNLGYLTGRVDRFNALVDMHTDDAVSALSHKKKKGKGEKEEGKSDGFFGAAVGEMFFRREGAQRPRHTQIIHPSDGHPQEELSPDFNWFRPLSWNNPTWTLYWPELTV